MIAPAAESIDLNADAGEGFDSPELFAAITSVNIACGAHAGDEVTMRAALELARACGVAAGAHPGYADRDRFGRVETADSARAIGETVRRQVARLAEAAAAVGVPLTHVKPHGALYHRLTDDAEAARACVAAVASQDPGLAIVGFPGSQLLLAARAAGLASIPEGFCDRRYGGDGSLLARAAEVLPLTEKEAIAQALRLAADGVVRTICLHSDHQGAAELAAAVRAALAAAGRSVTPFTEAIRHGTRASSKKQR